MPVPGPKPKPSDLSGDGVSASQQAQDINPAPTPSGGLSEADQILSTLQPTKAPQVPAAPTGEPGAQAAGAAEQILGPISPPPGGEQTVFATPVQTNTEADSVLGVGRPVELPANFDKSALADHGLLRAMASFGVDNKESAKIIQRGLGDKGQVFFDDKNIYVLKNGQKVAEVTDVNGTPNWKEFVGDLQDAVGPATEIFLNGVLDASAAPILATGGFPAYAAVASANSAAVSAVMEGVSSMFGGDPSAEEVKRHVLTSAGFGALAGAFNKVIGTISSGVRASYEANSKALAMKKTNELLNDMAALSEKMGGKKSSSELGKSIGGEKFQTPLSKQGSVADIQQKLAKDISLTIDELYSHSDGKKYDMSSALQSIKEQLQNNGVEFNKSNGRAVLPKALTADEATTIEVGSGLFDAAGNPIYKSVPGVPKKQKLLEATPLFNEIGSRSEAARAADVFNTLLELQRGGGINVKDASKWTQALDRLSEYDEKNVLGEHFLQFYRDAADSMRQVRDSAVADIATTKISDPARKQFILGMYDDASTKIPMLKDLEKRFRQAMTESDFANNLIRPKDSSGVDNLVHLFGKNSDIMKEIKTNWVSNLLEGSVDKISGAFNAQKFFKDYNAFGSDVINRMLTSSEQSAVEQIYKNGAKIFTENLEKKPQNLLGIGTILRLFMGSNRLIQGTGQYQSLRFVVESMKNNPGSLDFLREDGLRNLANLAAKAGDKNSSNGFMTLMQGLNKAAGFLKREELPDGRSVYRTTPAYRAFLRTMAVQQGRSLISDYTAGREPQGERAMNPETALGAGPGFAPATGTIPTNPRAFQ